MARSISILPSGLLPGRSSSRDLVHRTSGRSDTCLGRTCMKWGADGELSALDLQLVLERLSRVDQCADALHNNIQPRSNHA